MIRNTLKAMFIFISCLIGSYQPVLAVGKTEGFWHINTRDQYNKISLNENLIVVASTGLSGSMLLYHTISDFAPQNQVLKTHLLPPQNPFEGKILFIFSNPDLAAEGALHWMIRNSFFGLNHFIYVETSDMSWLNGIQNTEKQTISHNLLTYDALGSGIHLSKWLHEETIPTTLENAQILAIKYENLWDRQTIKAMKRFLKLQTIELPVKRNRGYKQDQLTETESIFRSTYNLGTFEKPRYTAYDEAREIWEAAPPFQFLKIVKQ